MNPSVLVALRAPRDSLRSRYVSHSAFAISAARRGSLSSTVSSITPELRSVSRTRVRPMSRSIASSCVKRRSAYVRPVRSPSGASRMRQPASSGSAPLARSNSPSSFVPSKPGTRMRTCVASRNSTSNFSGASNSFPASMSARRRGGSLPSGSSLAMSPVIGASSGSWTAVVSANRRVISSGSCARDTTSSAVERARSSSIWLEACGARPSSARSPSRPCDDEASSRISVARAR
ncbi:MAG: hypothetical protein NTV21_09890 [Planctomycetota bacterium]|nr:hypothetical protein [Planctomycetota bacterium]